MMTGVVSSRLAKALDTIISLGDPLAQERATDLSAAGQRQFRQDIVGARAVGCREVPGGGAQVLEKSGPGATADAGRHESLSPAGIRHTRHHEAGTQAIRS